MEDGDNDTSAEAVEESWNLPADFDLFAKHEVRTVCYPANEHHDCGLVDCAARRSFRIECIEPDTPLDINARGQSSSRHDATGHCVWAGALLLVNRVGSMGRLGIGNKRVIELGCGTGIGGISTMLAGDAAVAPSYVCFTDSDPAALEVCRRNCRLNGLPESSFSIRELAWGKDPGDSGIAGSFDVALATDVLYDVDLAGPLFTTASACVRRGGAFVLSHIPRACYNEGNPPDAAEDLERWFIDRAAEHGLHLEEIMRPPDEEDIPPEILEWCTVNSFVGGGILVFKRL